MCGLMREKISFGLKIEYCFCSDVFGGAIKLFIGKEQKKCNFFPTGLSFLPLAITPFNPQYLFKSKQ